MKGERESKKEVSRANEEVDRRKRKRGRREKKGKHIKGEKERGEREKNIGCLA